MHGSAHGDYNVRDILGNARFLSHVHIGGNGSHRGAGAEGDRRRPEQVPEHDLRAALAAAETGVHWEGGKHIDEAHNVVHHQRPGIIADELWPIKRHQIGEKTEKADGRIIGDDLHSLEHTVRQAGQQLGHRSIRTASPLHGKAEDDRSHDQGQHGLAAPQRCKIRHRKEIHDHFRGGYAAYFAFRWIIRARHQRDNPANGVHHHGSDGSRHQKRHKGSTHDFSCAANPLHIGDGRGNGTEHHGHRNAEHHIDENGSQRFQTGCSRPNRSNGAARYDRDQHTENEPVLFQKFLHWLCPLQTCCGIGKTNFKSSTAFIIAYISVR